MANDGDNKKDKDKDLSFELPSLRRSPDQFLLSSERQQASGNVEENLLLKADALMEDPANLGIVPVSHCSHGSHGSHAQW